MASQAIRNSFRALRVRISFIAAEILAARWRMVEYVDRYRRNVRNVDKCTSWNQGYTA